MTTTPVNSTATPIAQLMGAKTAKAKDPSGELGSDAFLKLLVAQLKYQDPLNPADGAEFLAQTAQFTMVEKLTTMVTQGEEVARSQKETQAAQLVGKQVTYVSPSGAKSEGIVESTSFSKKDGQTLMIDGKSVKLSAVTGVTGGPSDSDIAQALNNLGPSLTANLAPELVRALQNLGLTQFGAPAASPSTVIPTVTSPSGNTAITVPAAEEG
jgi:flagellar basal-body rod modification protein FlgD